MKKIFVPLFCFCFFFTKAQDSSGTKPQFKLSLNFNSNLNYYGRTDSLKSTGVFPMAEFWITPKFYINAAPVFVNNNLQTLNYAGTVTTAGYQNVTDKWITNIYALKPFYKAGTPLVQSALQAQTGISFCKLNKIINVTIGGDAKFSDKIDFGATGGLDHLIKISNKDGSAWIIDPSAYVYGGTQNFTNTYNRKKAGTLIFPGSTEQVTEKVQSFNVLAYEASMPVIFVKDKWMILATPSYIMPQNLVTVPNRPDLSERGENTLYVTLGIKRTF